MQPKKTLSRHSPGGPDLDPSLRRYRTSNTPATPPRIVSLIMEGTMGSVRAVRTNRRTRQTGRSHHRGSPDLLDWRLNAKDKNPQSQAQSPTRNSSGADFRSCEPSHEKESKG
jgi:hypothetical protein